MIVDSLPHYLSWKETREDCTRWVLYDWESLYNLKTHSVTAGHNSRPAKQRLISLRIIAGCQSCQLCQEISLALLSLIEMKFFLLNIFNPPACPCVGPGSVTESSLELIHWDTFAPSPLTVFPLRLTTRQKFHRSESVVFPVGTILPIKPNWWGDIRSRELLVLF